MNPIWPFWLFWPFRFRPFRPQQSTRSPATLHPPTIALFIGVSVNLPNARRLHAATNEPLSQDRTISCKVHGTLLQPSDIWKAFDFGGKWLYMERYELSEMFKQLGPKGLQLVGFKPQDRLKFYHNLQANPKRPAAPSWPCPVSRRLPDRRLLMLPPEPSAHIPAAVSLPRARLEAQGLGRRLHGFGERNARQASNRHLQVSALGADGRHATRGATAAAERDRSRLAGVCQLPFEC